MELLSKRTWCMDSNDDTLYLLLFAPGSLRLAGCIVVRFSRAIRASSMKSDRDFIQHTLGVHALPAKYVRPVSDAQQRHSRPSRLFCPRMVKFPRAHLMPKYLQNWTPVRCCVLVSLPLAPYCAFGP